MAGKRIYDTDPSKSLSPLSGAGSANDDKFVVFDTSEGVTKRMDRSQVAIGLVGDLPYTPSGGISATTIPTAIAELDSEAAKSAALAASGGSSLVGHIASGTGATARTVQDKLRDVVSVKDFGAVGDGVTDDTAAIQAAIDSGASRIAYPDGTYIVNGLVLRSFQTHFAATGGARISTTGTAYTWTSTQQFVTFDGLSFSGTGKAIYQPDPSFYGTAFIVKNCQFGNTLEECIYATTLLWDIHDNLFGANYGTSGAQHRQIFLKGTVAGGLAINQNTIRKNRFFRAKGSGTSALYIEFGNGNSVERNTFEECYVTPIILDRAGLTPLIGNWFEGNNVDNQIECRNTVVGATFYRTKINANENSFLLLNAACQRVFEMDINSQVVDLGGSNLLTTTTPAISRRNSIVNAGVSNWRANTFDGSWDRNTATLITNGNAASGTTGWTLAFATLAAITGGGPTGGNYFELTATTGSNQRMEQVVSGLSVGKKYRAEFWTKSGTSGNEAWLWEVINDYTRNANGATTASWVKSSLDFVALETFATFRLYKNTSTIGTMLFGDIKVFEIME